jgi:hypothetical protein
MILDYFISTSRIVNFFVEIGGVLIVRRCCRVAAAITISEIVLCHAGLTPAELECGQATTPPAIEIK